MERQQLFQYKMQELVEMLTFMANHFPEFRFVLGYTSPHTGTASYRNSNLKIDEMRGLINYLYDVQLDLEYIPRLLDSGHMIVTCIDDSNCPENFVGNWIKKDGNYIVEAVLKSDNSGYCLKLKGMVTEQPFIGYDCKRFKALCLTRQYN